MPMHSFLDLEKIYIFVASFSYNRIAVGKVDCTYRTPYVVYTHISIGWINNQFVWFNLKSLEIKIKSVGFHYLSPVSGRKDDLL